MGCACKAGKHIQVIEKKYGTGVRYKEPVPMAIQDIIKRIIGNLTILLFFPFMILHVLFVAFFSKNRMVDYNKVLGRKRKKNVGLQ